MTPAREHRLRQIHVALLAGLVAFNGANTSIAASVGLLGFALLVVAGLAIPFHRAALHRLLAVALIAPLLVVGWTLVQIHWDPSGAAAHPVWAHLREQFGAEGGARAVLRWQPLWELSETLLPFFAAAAAVPLYRDRRHAEQLFRRLALLGLAFAGYGFAQSLLFPQWHFGPRLAYADSLTGFYVYRNAAAAFLVLVTLAALTGLDAAIDHVDAAGLREVLARRRPAAAAERRLVLHLALVFFLIVALLLTKSRAGAALGLLAVGAYGALRLPSVRRRLAWRPSRAVTIAAAVVAVAVVAFLAMRVLTRLDTKGLDDARWCVYPAAWRLALDNLPFGIGIGGFPAAFPAYRRPECGLFGIWETAHDSWIEGLIAVGLLFPVLLAMIAAVVLPPLVPAARAGHRARPIVLAALLAAAAMAVHSLVDFPLEIPANAVVLATLLTAAVGAATEGRRLAGRAPKPPDARPR